MRFESTVGAGALTCALLLPAPALAQDATVRVHCDGSSQVVLHTTTEGCHAVASPGPSFLDLEGGAAILYPDEVDGCSGGDRLIVGPGHHNFCGMRFPDGASLNDNVRSVWLVPVLAEVSNHGPETRDRIEQYTAWGCHKLAMPGPSGVTLSHGTARLFPDGATGCDGAVFIDVAAGAHSLTALQFPGGAGANDNVSWIQLREAAAPAPAGWAKAAGAATCSRATMVDTAEECRTAGAAVGHPFNKEVEASAASFNGAGRPGGCFWDQNGSSYFNRNLDSTATWGGTGGICRTGGAN